AYSDNKIDRAREYLSESMLRGPEIFMFAYRALPLYRMLSEDNKSPELMEMIKTRLTEGLDSFFKDYDSETDRKIAAALMKLYAENVDAEFHPGFFANVVNKQKGNFDKYTA